jgi:hypothetical protein
MEALYAMSVRIGTVLKSGDLMYATVFGRCTEWLRRVYNSAVQRDRALKISAAFALLLLGRSPSTCRVLTLRRLDNRSHDLVYYIFTTQWCVQSIHRRLVSLS